LRTPLDFVSTDDIIGGNSGSPVVNRAGEFVGIIFDGNLQSLPWDYAYSDQQGRAISVDSAAIVEALNRVYQTKSLVHELSTGSMAR
jgi:S1-C subfamily serine protease